MATDENLSLHFEKMGIFHFCNINSYLVTYHFGKVYLQDRHKNHNEY